ncbi:MAG: hypothetical protein WCK21_09650, partial [Actinomycetota bacterium]
MTVTLHIHLGDRHSTFAVDGEQVVVPVGADTLAAMLTTDPPRPEDLTNAIGLLLDHLEDVTREVPAAELADVVEIRGVGLQTLVDVETGHPRELPFDLSREAAEDVFRTLATEATPDRLRNPGLPANEVHLVLG